MSAKKKKKIQGVLRPLTPLISRSNCCLPINARGAGNEEVDISFGLIASLAEASVRPACDSVSQRERSAWFSVNWARPKRAHLPSARSSGASLMDLNRLFIDLVKIQWVIHLRMPCRRYVSIQKIRRISGHRLSRPKRGERAQELLAPRRRLTCAFALSRRASALSSHEPTAQGDCDFESFRAARELRASATGRISRRSLRSRRFQHSYPH